LEQFAEILPSNWTVCDRFGIAHWDKLYAD
jgi:hypothetical protein